MTVFEVILQSVLALFVALPQGPANESTDVAIEGLTAVTLAVEDDAAPWSVRDGSGFANDIVRAAFAAAGVELHLQVVPYARCKRMAVAGEVAGCFSMSPDPVPNAAIAFPSGPIFTCHSELVVRRGSSPALPLRRGAVVGVVVGYEYPADVQRLEREGKITFDAAGSEEVLLRKLADRRIDAAIINVNAAKSLRFVAAHAGVAGRVEAAGSLGDLKSYVGFSTTHVDGKRALAAFDIGMRRVAASGELARIERVWRQRLTVKAR